VYVSVKPVKNKWMYFRAYSQTEAKKDVYPKSGAAGQKIPEILRGSITT
jgi:hypothetical protein